MIETDLNKYEICIEGITSSKNVKQLRCWHRILSPLLLDSIEIAKRLNGLLDGYSTNRQVKNKREGKTNNLNNDWNH